MKRILPLPDYQFRFVTDITAEFLTKNNIKLLMLDLDNTVASYTDAIPSKMTIDWVSHLKEQGIVLCFVSNSKLPKRVENFAEAMDIPFVKAAGKPRTRGLRTSMSILSKHPDNCALVGDQIFTDVWAAKRAGVHAILVKPISFSRPFFYLRYLIEYPFRLFHRRK